MRGGGRKPFAQKGTGRARAGTIRAPQVCCLTSEEMRTPWQHHKACPYLLVPWRHGIIWLSCFRHMNGVCPPNSTGPWSRRWHSCVGACAVHCHAACAVLAELLISFCPDQCCLHIRSSSSCCAAAQHRGGGVAHGPVPRSHAHDLQRKVRRMGLTCALSVGTLFTSLTAARSCQMQQPCVWLECWCCSPWL